jgi:hypothetical protein
MLSYFFIDKRIIFFELENCLAQAAKAYQTLGPLPTISRHQFAMPIVSPISQSMPFQFVQR